MVSVVVPTFNEVSNVESLLERIEKALFAFPKAHEIVVVDDFSTDGTWELLLKLRKKFPLRVFRKEGEKGKSYSLVEGFSKASGNILVMIDADLQYPPEAIADLVSGLSEVDIVVANRSEYKAPIFRKTFSKIFKFAFGRLLHGIGCDVQSGLKAFKRQVFETVKFSPKSPWSFDLEFLVRAKNAGFSVGEVDVAFEKRQGGDSKISFLRNGWDLATNALALKTLRQAPVHIRPEEGEVMRGAGVGFLGRKFITHTTLSHRKSAVINFTFLQKVIFASIFGAAALGFFLGPLQAVAVFIAVLSTIYFFDVVFNLFLVLRSLQSPPDITFTPSQIAKLDDEELPVYSVLCPLYREAAILPNFLDALEAIDWPKEKLDVLLLLEADDKETIKALDNSKLPKYIKKVIVPHSLPKTKPKACNYGLTLAKGEYVVIYDAEDIPDPQQLKKAYLGFLKLPREVVCLQAKLNYFNPDQNFLTRLFTAEYSLWFDLTLTGMQSINTAIPLGGTSNHFRTEDLRRFEGWDPFNVTEDADLGVRLFKIGYKTAIIDSTTLEEANSQIGNWIRQRSRWIKGYMQTYLVHTRNPVEFVRENGIHAFIFQLIVGGKIAFIFINPILWLLTIAYFVLNAAVGTTIEALFPSFIFYMAVSSLVFGNFLFVYYYMIGCAKREQWGLMRYVFLVPFYWLLVSVAGVKALYQLIFKPHFWEKTVHGLNLENRNLEKEFVEDETEPIPAPKAAYTGLFDVAKLRLLAKSGKAAGGILILASVVGNFFNFAYNAYLGRTISIEQFGLVSLVGSFLFIVTIPFNSLSRTVTHRSAYFLGEYGSPVKLFWRQVRKRAIVFGLVFTGLWLGASPFIAPIFKSDSILPFVLFAPVWYLGLISAIDVGFLYGNMKFVIYAGLMVVGAISKFVISWILVSLGLPQYVYAAIPASIGIAALLAWLSVNAVSEKEVVVNVKKAIKFPVHFFMTSAFSEFSILAFLSFDVILAKVFLSPKEAGEYAVLALFGKMIFFMGGLFGQFITPIISREEGAKRDSRKAFYKLFLASAISSTMVYLGVSFLGFEVAELLIGQKIHPVEHLIPYYGFGILAFTIAARIVNYYQVKHQHIFPIVSFVLALGQIGGIFIFHNSVPQIVDVMLVAGIANLVAVMILHFFRDDLATLGSNFKDIIDLFKFDLPKRPAWQAEKRILIFNWRDTRHVWAGGAEVYIHEIAKGLIKNGNQVTVFCGNDRKNPTYECIDGVEIIRRGGFYTIYLLAPLYYLLKLRKHFDLVIDSENGIPFFTPLYVGKPIVGLVHHIHQDVFRTKLRFPFAQFGKFLEGVLMPFIYQNVKLVTVSKSSKLDMEKIGLGRKIPIDIIHPGVDLTKFKPMPKAKSPVVLYLGRLKPYKSIDILIKAFALIKADMQKAKLVIAGEGESRSSLEELAEELKLGDAVQFLGKISEKTKTDLLAKSWVLAQPSMVEGWGITVIEANASGTPVVASNVPGLRDSVKNPHNGFLVPWGDSSELAQKITLLIRDDRLRRDFEKFSVRWAENFSWEQSTETLEKIIEKNRKLS